MEAQLQAEGWNTRLLGNRGRGRIVATHPDSPGARIEIDYKRGFDAYAAWRYVAGEREVANNYTDGRLIEYLRGRTR